MIEDDAWLETRGQTAAGKATTCANAGERHFRGETGTGKDLMARLAHDRSGRSGRLVKVDCPAMTESLIESELFGHEKGAYTGAGSRHVGLIEEAQGGPVCVDEFGELPQRVQVKLLCVF